MLHDLTEVTVSMPSLYERFLIAGAWGHAVPLEPMGTATINTTSGPVQVRDNDIASCEMVDEGYKFRTAGSFVTGEPNHILVISGIVNDQTWQKDLASVRRFDAAT